MCDALGNPVDLMLTPGQAHDLDGADAMIPRLRATALIADRGYDADGRVLDRLAGAKIDAVIPSRRGRLARRGIDRHLYARRHLVENFFARLKLWRGIATRYDKTARNFLGAIHLAAAVILLN